MSISVIIIIVSKDVDISNDDAAELKQKLDYVGFI
jgi:hypothetical protein